MKVVFIAGATGYLGKYLCSAYAANGWTVRALVRDREKAKASGLKADVFVQAEATSPKSLRGVMQDVDLVVSCLGITTQKDGLSYQDVDFQANMNLLGEAMSAGVAQFAYVHVLAAHLMPQVSLIAAKSQFVATLQAANIRSTVIAPSGYFSDMAEIFSMAQSGRVWGFGKGDGLLNPIHGEDLAEAVIEAADKGLAWLDVGGPDVLTYDEIARLAFAALNKPPKITYLPDILRRMALGLGRYIMPAASFGPVEFFLSAMEIEMVGEPHGHRHLAEYFKELAKDH